jgi:hypothetical protein
MDGLDIINPGCVLYKTLKCNSVNISFFLNNFSPDFMYSNSVDLSSDDCIQEFSKFVDKLHSNITQDICDNLETGTRGQDINTNWIEARKVLITASNMGSVCKRTKQEPDKLVSTLRGYRQQPTGIRSIQHGKKYEKQALKDYVRKHMSICGGNVEVHSRGLVVNPNFPYLGASVDGYVTCNNCGVGVVEVKCPYGSDNKDCPWRNMTPEDCAKDKSFFCTISDNSLHLNKNHNYMYQVQGQMAILDLQWAEFVVWTKKGISCERIPFTKSFWSEKMLPKLREFYFHGIVPELFSDRIKRGLKLY